MNNLLLDSQPLVIIPELAEIIGLNEAIILQQIHYWLNINKKTNKNFRDGFYWTYNSYEEWQKQFPFWSIRTITRIFSSLEKDGLLISSNYNKLKIDRTKWYRIDYERLQTLIIQSFRQNDIMDMPDCLNGFCQNGITITRDYKETKKTETNVYMTLASHDNFISFYLKAHKDYLKKDHVRVTKEQLEFIDKSIDNLKSQDVTFEQWQEAVIEHFENLPKKNNGNILAFLKASYRHFEVTPLD